MNVYKAYEYLKILPSLVTLPCYCCARACAINAELYKPKQNSMLYSGQGWWFDQLRTSY